MARGDNFRKHKEIWCRKIDDGELIMPRHDMVLLKTAQLETRFHCFWAPRGHYTNSWAPFVARIKRNRHLNSQAVNKLANRYGIQRLYKTTDKYQRKKEEKR